MRAIAATIFALALAGSANAATVNMIDWNEHLDVRLLCSQTGMLICSVSEPSCGTVQDLSFTDIAIDLNLGTARYIPMGDRDFDLQPVSARIDERGFNGEIRARMGGAGLTVGFFRPSDLSAPISFSQTTEKDGFNQVIFGRCTRQ